MRQLLLVFVAATLCVGCAQSKEIKPSPVYRKAPVTRPAAAKPVVRPAAAPTSAAQGSVQRRAAPQSSSTTVQVPSQPHVQQQSPVQRPVEVYQPPVRVPAPIVSAPPPAGVPVEQALDPSVYRLAPGDAVRVDVFGEPDLSLSAAIESSGSINYPLLGRVEVAGTTVRQLESRIASGLRGGYLVNPDVRVSIAQYRPIFVTGQVRRVGSYPYTIGLTVDRALAMAGGITEYGSTKKVYLQRENVGDDARERVNLDQPVFPGDTILVDERLF